MCGRYTVTTKRGMLEERFDAEVPEDYVPRYNAAPTQNLPVILNTNPQKISLVHWGLMPHWAKNRGGIINVRDDTLKEKSTFKSDLQNRRCLVIADGFYEWQKQGEQKQPFRITLKDKTPFALAGIWETNKISETNDIQTFAIITTEPNALMKPIHNRMPVILSKQEEQEWLEEGKLNLLDSFPAAKLLAYPVSTLVNKPAFDRPDAIKSIETK